MRLMQWRLCSRLQRLLVLLVVVLLVQQLPARPARGAAQRWPVAEAQAWAAVAAAARFWQQWARLQPLAQVAAVAAQLVVALLCLGMWCRLCAQQRQQCWPAVLHVAHLTRFPAGAASKTPLGKAGGHSGCRLGLLGWLLSSIGTYMRVCCGVCAHP